MLESKSRGTSRTWPPSSLPHWGCEVDSQVRTHPAAAITLRLLAATPGGPELVGVDGRSGSGKTRLAAGLAENLRGHRKSVVVITMDDLYPGWDGLSASLPRLCAGVIKPLSRGCAGAYERYDWGTERFAETVDVPLADVVIIEGVGATAHPCRAALTTTVWVHASPLVRRERARRRTDQGDFAPHADRWAAQEDELFGADTYPKAPAGYDFVVDTDKETDERTDPEMVLRSQQHTVVSRADG
ncbi:MAG: hypothetical protein WA903_07085 [Ornithinimicrobium sp.]